MLKINFKNTLTINSCKLRNLVSALTLGFGVANIPGVSQELLQEFQTGFSSDDAAGYPSPPFSSDAIF